MSDRQRDRDAEHQQQAVTGWPRWSEDIQRALDKRLGLIGDALVHFLPPGAP
jgi:hypothetical protein